MIISKTPLRASFFGGGTDFYDYYANSKYGYGTTISTALNMYLYITVNKTFDDEIRVRYSENEIVNDVEKINHNIIREALKLVGIKSGVEIVYSADLPLKSVGIGLASSSALAVGVLNALYAFKGIYKTPEELAKDACKIEIDILKNPIGIQDQYAVAYGGFRQYKFYRDNKVDAVPIIFNKDIKNEFKSNLMLFFTGLTRNSSTILKEQKSNIESKMELLDSMVYETENAYKYLVTGELEKIGNLFDIMWERKKQYASNVTNYCIEDMYFKAKEAGALGGKILGAGGGGFMLLYVPEEKQDDVKKALKDYRRIDFDFESGGSRIIFSE